MKRTSGQSCSSRFALAILQKLARTGTAVQNQEQTYKPPHGAREIHLYWFLLALPSATSVFRTRAGLTVDEKKGQVGQELLLNCKCLRKGSSDDACSLQLEFTGLSL